ncbi:DUF962 domain-containing protein [Sinomicrobium weinanense]|uniref:DUF962 domain-containing protein n=1 Tax=Sinomicrobium weinanense TaxID=2842200 RepID=A0A926JUB6_9FLAO|nr:Mpo1-like protein [Sinomicrobium weinanense]MBC9797382.1 DUF962 domain-containing protein [Sinomicrobium weinanense]MBU3123387.1 DUF962 domain-containing protein [Sinomicrobium weinanense]
MKTLQQWFDDYAVSHQNRTNKKIHYICVPAIFFSIVGLLMSIPAGPLQYILPGVYPYIENWAVVVLVFVLVFYARLSFAMALKILVFASLCVVLNTLIARVAPLWLVSLLIFALAWIGQFYGHKIEGKKPSFLKDIQFLLIGPAWVMDNIFKKG